MCLMLATALHSIAVGNLLPARVRTVCVDMTESVPVKLSNRGTLQAIGLVTDVGLLPGAPGSGAARPYFATNVNRRSLLPTPSKIAWTVNDPGFSTLSLRWKSLWIEICTMLSFE